MIATLASVTTLALVALAAYGLGRPCLRRIVRHEADSLAVVVFGMGLGLMGGGLVLTALGLAGFLYVELIGVLTFAAASLGAGELVRAARAANDRSPLRAAACDPVCGAASGYPRARPVVAFGVVLGAIAVAGSFVAALAPPTAGDALCYHLELPKEFLASHRLVYLPFQENSTFPLHVEMLYLWALALDGAVAAQLIHWGMGVLLVLGTVVLARPVVGQDAAWGTAAVVAVTPGVTNQMTAPLNDVGLALFTTLALAAWRRVAVDDQSRRWLLVAGLMAGAALATKYVAVVFAAAVVMSALVIAIRQPDRRHQLIFGAVVTAAVALLVGGIWYIRAAWYRGNALYPFDPLAVLARSTEMRDKTPLEWNVMSLVSAPWQVTMHPERFGGWGHQPGELFLALLPCLVVARRLRGLSSLLAVAATFALFWYALRQNVRFLLPIVPLLAVAAVWAIVQLERFPVIPRRIAYSCVAALASCGAAIAIARAGDKLAVALGLESRDDYLMRCEPTYPAASLANRLTRSRARILSQDYRAFYFQGHVTRESTYRRATRYDQAIRKPTDFSRQLRAHGFTHVLLAESDGRRGIRYEPTLSRLAERQLAADRDDSLVCLRDYRFTDADGAIRRYRLLMLR